MPAKPFQIAKYGHIAVALRAAMEVQGMAPSELTAKLGIVKGRTTIYPWINGTSAPSPAFRTKLMKVLNLTKADLTAKDLDTPNLPAVAHTNAVTIQGQSMKVGMVALRASEVLQFTILTNGQARVKLDITLNTQDAMPLVRLLMDAEVVKSFTPIHPSYSHTGDPQPVSLNPREGD